VSLPTRMAMRATSRGSFADRSTPVFWTDGAGRPRKTGRSQRRTKPPNCRHTTYVCKSIKRKSSVLSSSSVQQVSLVEKWHVWSPAGRPHACRLGAAAQHKAANFRTTSRACYWPQATSLTAFQSMGFKPFCTRYSLAFTKWPQPKKPRDADNGDGCTVLSTRCLD